MFMRDANSKRITLAILYKKIFFGRVYSTFFFSVTILKNLFYSINKLKKFPKTKNKNKYINNLSKKHVLLFTPKNLHLSGHY